MLSTLRLTLCVALVTLSSSRLQAQDTRNFPVIGEIIRNDAALDALIAPDTQIEVVASGFLWSEGPLWVSEKDGPGYLLFSDIPRNSIMKWVEGQGVSLYMKPAGYTGITDYGLEPGSNGLALDAKGRLICCEHGDRRVSVLTEAGGKMTLADRIDGKRLNSPNDVTVASNGDLYFTDPPYGLKKQLSDPLAELDFCGVYRLSAAGKLTLLTKELTRPNGVALSPDEKTLYVPQSDKAKAVLMAYPLQADGTLGTGKVLYDFTSTVSKMPGLPDGMDVDKQGNIFCTGPGGVTVLTSEGKLLGRISTGEACANCTFGGPDRSTLYIASDMYIARVKTKTSK